jgi:hypothetical protein
MMFSSSLPPVVCWRTLVVFTSSCLLEDSCCIYLQLFVGGLMLYLPPVVCWSAHVVFTSSCLLEGSCCIYLHLFVGGLMLYLPPVVCWRAHVVFSSSCLLEGSCCIYLHLFVGGLMLYCVVCVCLPIVMSAILSYLMLSVLWCPLRFTHRNDLRGSSLPPVVCRRVDVLFMLFVFVAYSGVQHVWLYMSNRVGVL